LEGIERNFGRQLEVLLFARQFRKLASIRMGAQMAAVSLKDIVKVYGRHVAVRGIDLEIPDKSFTVFVGPSGCGKSTMLRMIAGLETISYGEMRLDGTLVNETPSRERGVAMVFQSYALYPHMTVRQNLEFSLKLEKLPPSVIEARVNQAVSILEIGAYIDRKPTQLSGGQRQRVAMGRAIVREPVVFLFDEPLSNLDAKLRNQMRIEIKKLQRRLQVTTIYVTHDQVEAMTLADVIVVMRDGVIEQTGSPLQVFENPVNQFVAGFIGTPQMNFFEGHAKVSKRESQFVGETVSFPIPRSRFATEINDGQTLVAGFRPEHIMPLSFRAKSRKPNTFNATVGFTEILGNETLLFSTLGKTEFVSRMLQPRAVAQDEEFDFEFNVEKMHLFNGETGTSMRAA
jgi:multiple sugar transport system ATP-binding protein